MSNTMGRLRFVYVGGNTSELFVDVDHIDETLKQIQADIDSGKTTMRTENGIINLSQVCNVYRIV